MSWRSILTTTRKYILPANSRREQWARRLVGRVAGRKPASGEAETGWFSDHYQPEDFGSTVLYTDQPDLFPSYPLREYLQGPRTRIPVSLIATLKNEAGTVETWMEGIYRQNRLPDEIVLVDGGSTDGTLEKLQALAQQSPVPLRILSAPRTNIAHGRNLAIGQAAHEVIAATDFGCRPQPDWLDKLIAPFERDSQMETVAGWYVPTGSDGRPLRRRIWPRLEHIDPGTFVPSSRSVAFTKTAWQKAQGYPEWLTLTGEDSYFGLELRRFCVRRAFVPEAVVCWLAPEDTWGYWQKTYSWAIGDGEIGLNSALYSRSARLILSGAIGLIVTIGLMFAGLLTRHPLLYLVAALAVAAALAGMSLFYRKLRLSPLDFGREVGAMAAQAFGFVQGARRRLAVDRRRFAQTEGTFIILAGVPIHDTGGGSRGAQIALELLRQNYRVHYVYAFDSYESVHLGLRILHPNLTVQPLKNFNWAQTCHRYGEPPKGKLAAALVEFPLREFLPLLADLKASGVAVIYDLLDNWETQLGSTWYDREVEALVIGQANVLIATAPSLVDQLAAKTSKPVTLLPNAVNARLFNPRRHWPQPADLPAAEMVITYIGALWGEWFDWQLLGEIARPYPQAAMVVIGDYAGQCAEPPANLHFLGLKPQSDLPAYLASTDVAIIPWKENEITYATSPLKLYEYLAMHVPVVVPNLPLLHGIPAVHLAHSQADFLQAISLAAQSPVDTGAIDAFIIHHTWETRVSQILSLLSPAAHETRPD